MYGELYGQEVELPDDITIEVPDLRRCGECGTKHPGYVKVPIKSWALDHGDPVLTAKVDTEPVLEALQKAFMNGVLP